jgi:poly(hydroxyalkanoate) depolymerase family esterase
MRLLSADPIGSAWLEGTVREPRGRGLLGRLRHRELAYRLFLPTRSVHTTQVPLLVMLHGCTQDAQTFAAGTRMNSIAESDCFAVLYPQQSRKANYLRCWNWFEPETVAGNGEAALIIDTVKEVLNKHPIDPTRIFVAGMSAGGAMAALLAARYGRLFAACAIHSGVMFRAATNATQALTAMRRGAHFAPAESAQLLLHELGGALAFVPTLVIQGGADATVNPLNSTQIVEQLCALADKLSPDEPALSPTAERLMDSGGRSLRQRDYKRGNEVLVRSIVIEELGHAWSGGDSLYEYHDGDGPDASQLIAEFVLKYRRVSPETGDANALRAPQISSPP